MSLIGQRSCVLLKSGMVRCWGFGGSVLGLGTMSPNLGDNPGELPTPDLALGGASVGIRGGNSAYCALRDTGVVRCWGDNFFGQLGINSTAKIGLNPGDMPPADSLVGKPAVQLGGGGSGVNGGTFCAITSRGDLRCWGGNATGMLGLGHTMVIGDDPGELPGAAPVSILISNLVAFAIQVFLFLGFILYYWWVGSAGTPNWAVILLPFYILVMAGLGLGFGIIVSALTPRYRDLQFQVRFGVQLAMYATPIIYPLSSIPEKYQMFIIANPMTAIVEAFRYSFLGSGSINPIHLIYSFVFMLVTLMIGILLFNRVETRFMGTV